MPAEDQSSVAAPKPHRIEAKFYNTRGAQFDRIINSVDPGDAIDGKNKWYKFSFVTPLYLTQIRITTEGYSSYNSFELVVDHIDGTHHEQKMQVDDDVVDLKLGKLCSAFRFRPESKFLSTPKLIQVTAAGLTLDEFHKMEMAIRDFDRNNAELIRKQGEYKALEAELSSKQANKTLLESEVGKSQAQLSQLEQQIASNEIRAEDSSLALKTAQSELETRTTTLNNINKDISEARESLDGLTNQLRLFPSEISGFVREGNRSTWWYTGLGLPFTIILFVVMASLFFSAADLTVIWKKDSTVDIWTIFLTRIPFVVVAVTLIEERLKNLPLSA
ncbi:hypothetical protein [Phaeovulum sp.]|uniref:hypothetical protein n=1 Tax=Phaeovulum sp. TaxID=2934796 RepID=UPI0027314692|nr:hypothetical protein [Phaeovulum sp.]MDP1667897.1 hypothetical protein [Phaeovulum sp.]MDZ4117687.1 hypothetical protein [Phaeovulum sp.]